MEILMLEVIAAGALLLGHLLFVVRSRFEDSNSRLS